MESFGNLFDEDQWHNLDKMFSTDEGSDQFVNQGLISSPCDLGLNFKIPSLFLPVSDESSNVYDNTNPSFYHFFSQENSISSSDANNGTTISIPYPSHESFPFCPSNVAPTLSNNDVSDQSIRFRMMNELVNSSLPTTQLFSQGNLYLTRDVAPGELDTSLKRKLESQELPDDEENHDRVINNNSKKRIRVSRDNKDKKNVQPKKTQKLNETEERNKKNNGEMNGQSSSSCSSNDDLNLSQDMAGASNTNGVTRASRGTATDPQSLYARKRRERINERLKILQNLVPNGTKVDISTMLEEAVEYVKFLKLQIQLLSSDDMWMYAPIAYNGMDMGLYQNIIPNMGN
ncbi:hypothetical protein SSX86_007750 [Deinandra increscens subsp. villosa]|uniref:BHLH domain-containing protein n=1 Tax=Deinandra increscens subsp. villosa TaxID=3103831 RepID=A0AAP0H616_9ASTR